MPERNYTVIFPPSDPPASPPPPRRLRALVIVFLILIGLTGVTYFLVVNETITFANFNFKKSETSPIPPSPTPTPTTSPLEWSVFENSQMGITFNYPAALTVKDFGLFSKFVKSEEPEKPIFEVSTIPAEQAALTQNAATLKTVDASLGFISPIKLLVNRVETPENQLAGKPAVFEIVGFFENGANFLKFRYLTSEDRWEKDLVTIKTILSTFKFVQTTSEEPAPTGFPTIPLPQAKPSPTP